MGVEVTSVFFLDIVVSSHCWNAGGCVESELSLRGHLALGRFQIDSIFFLLRRKGSRDSRQSILCRVWGGEFDPNWSIGQISTYLLINKRFRRITLHSQRASSQTKHAGWFLINGVRLCQYFMYSMKTARRRQFHLGSYFNDDCA